MVAAGEFGWSDRVAFHASAFALSLAERVIEVPGEMAQGMVTFASQVVAEVNKFDRNNTDYLGLAYQGSISRPFVNLGAVAWNTGKGLFANAGSSLGEGFAAILVGRNADEIGMGATRFITGACSAVSLAVAPLLPTSTITMTYPSITMGSDGSLAMATASVSVPIPSAGVGVAVAQGMQMKMSAVGEPAGGAASRGAAYLGQPKCLSFIDSVILKIEDQIKSLADRLKLIGDAGRAALTVERTELIALRNSLEHLRGSAIRGEHVAGHVETIFTSPAFHRLKQPGSLVAKLDRLLTDAFQMERSSKASPRGSIAASLPQ